jgi:hypothetical protein
LRGDGSIDVAFGTDFRAADVFGLVCFAGAPGYIVDVTEGVDIDYVDVGGREEEVLDGLGGC